MINQYQALLKESVAAAVKSPVVATALRYPAPVAADDAEVVSLARNVFGDLFAKPSVPAAKKPSNVINGKLTEHQPAKGTAAASDAIGKEFDELVAQYTINAIKGWKIPQ